MGLNPTLGCGPCVLSWSRGSYASYVHQRDFALQGGADAVTCALWPLSVDGLLLLATAGLLKPTEGRGRRSRYVVWVAFLLGIAVSLAANIAAAAALTWKPVHETHALSCGIESAVGGGW
ncbi:DUF2637 domain-containing protein [Streptomyces sp. 2A115]|uniref:DUF2637 domain-containing protein n=1 Tax=Streptomyces sp. 2A115 TaxID=3457439 RepID=UPI003FD527D1